jgi:hypothetical protein
MYFFMYNPEVSVLQYVYNLCIFYVQTRNVSPTIRLQIMYFLCTIQKCQSYNTSILYAFLYKEIDTS